MSGDPLSLAGIQTTDFESPQTGRNYDTRQAARPRRRPSLPARSEIAAAG